MCDLVGVPLFRSVDDGGVFVFFRADWHFLCNSVLLRLSIIADPSARTVIGGRAVHLRAAGPGMRYGPQHSIAKPLQRLMLAWRHASSQQTSLENDDVVAWLRSFVAVVFPSELARSRGRPALFLFVILMKHFADGQRTRKRAGARRREHGRKLFSRTAQRTSKRGCGNKGCVKRARSQIITSSSLLIMTSSSAHGDRPGDPHTYLRNSTSSAALFSPLWSTEGPTCLFVVDVVATESAPPPPPPPQNGHPHA